MTKKMVMQYIDVDLDYLKLSEAIETLANLKEEHGDVRLHVEANEEYESPRLDCYIQIPREETDREYEERVTWDKRVEAQQRRQYEELKKKFEGNT